MSCFEAVITEGTPKLLEHNDAKWLTKSELDEVNWMMVGSASLLAGILSLLTSVAGLPEVK